MKLKDAILSILFDFLMMIAIALFGLLVISIIDDIVNL